MFKVTFRDAANDRALTKTVFLPELPAKGEKVSVGQSGERWREKRGTVTDRAWFIFDDDPGVSEVVIMLSLDK